MKKNVAGQKIGAQMVSATDGSAFTAAVTALVTGDGGTQGGGGSCVHEGNGLHVYSPTQAETNYDHVAFTFTGTGAIPRSVQVYPSFPQTDDAAAGVATLLSRIGAALTITSGKVDVNDKTGFSLSSAGILAIWDAAVSALTTVGSIGKRLVDNIDAAISSRMATFTYTAPANSDITAIKNKTDNLPAAPAAVGSAMTLTSGERTAIANEVEAQIIDDTDSEKVLQAITDKIASVNPSLDDLTLAGIASAVRTELTTELGRIDVAVSTRLANADYTAPDNTTIGTIQTAVTAVKNKTDNLPADPADASDVTDAFAAVNTKLDTIDDFLDTEVAAIKNKTDLIPAAPAAVSDIPTAVENADALLDRNLGAGADTETRSVRNALRASRNKVVVGSSSITVYKENDSTTAWTAAITTDEAALPITSVDPA